MATHSERTPLKTVLLALLAGVLVALSFAPFAWWPLNLLGLGILFALWLHSSVRVAAWYGYAFGIGLFGIGISWIYVSIHNFGGLPPPLAALCVLLLVLGLALFPALAGLLQGVFGQRSVVARCVLVMPMAWLLMEWLRGWVLSGLPWLTTGYAMIDTPLSGLAPAGGVYLLSLVSLMTTGAVLVVATRPSAAGFAWVVVVVMAWFAGWQLQGISWTRATGGPVSVAIIQNNVPLMLKWDAAESDRIVSAYLEASSAHPDADLVVWPEAAVPDYLDRMPAPFWEYLERHPADFVFGALTRREIDGQSRHYNSIVAVSDQVEIYHKQHLVPFGEFYPMQWLLGPLVDKLNIPMSNFSHWPQKQKPLHAASHAFAASICYEDAFPGEWRNQVPASGFLLNVSEDMWFGDSLAPHQRLQMARFRSLESGRPMVRASNNGLSSLIDWSGEVVAIAPQFQVAAVTASMQPRSGVTPYTLYGNYPVLMLMAALGVLGMLFGGRKPGSP